MLIMRNLNLISVQSWTYLPFEQTFPNINSHSIRIEYPHENQLGLHDMVSSLNNYGHHHHVLFPLREIGP